jgi:hypothetical protein
MTLSEMEEVNDIEKEELSVEINEERDSRP